MFVFVFWVDGKRNKFSLYLQSNFAPVEEIGAAVQVTDAVMGTIPAGLFYGGCLHKKR